MHYNFPSKIAFPLVNWKSSFELFINIVLIITIAEFNLIYMDSRGPFLTLVNWKSSCILGTFY